MIFGPYEPDKGPLSETSIDTVVNALPISNGWGPMPKLTEFTAALPAECKGFWWFRATDGTFNTIATTQDNLWKLSSSETWTAIGKLAADTIVNGVFAADTDWTKDTGCTIAAGVATFTAVASGDEFSQAQAPTVGAVYKIVWTITAYTSGGVRVKFSGGSDVNGTTRTAAGTYTDYLTAVTGNNLFEIEAVGTTTASVDNVSMKKVGGYTGPGTGEFWAAAIFGTNFYVTNLNDPLQVLNTDTGTEFADATGSPPQAKYIATVGDFLFLSHLKVGATTFPRKWHHSAVNDPTDWSISGVSGDSDDQEIPDGEEIVGILPMEGSSARIFQRRARKSLVFSPGSNPVFQQIDIVSPIDGAPVRGVDSPHAIVPLGGGLYMILNKAGFFIGDQDTPVGDERVDRWFQGTVDSTKYVNVQGVADTVRKIVWIRFQDQAGIHQMLGYKWTLDRWTYSDVQAEVLGSSATAGFVLDDLPEVLDFYPETIDSAFWQGGTVTIGAFKADNKLHLFAGEKAAATIETATLQFNEGMTSFVSGAKLMGNITTFTMQVGSSVLPDSALSWSSAQTRSSRTGVIPFRSDAYFHRFRLNIAEGGAGTHVHGLQPSVRASGMT